MINNQIISFPRKGNNIFSVLTALRALRSKYSKNNDVYNFGWLHTPAHNVAVSVYNQWLSVNPNHLGTWSDAKNITQGTKALEKQVIESMIKLLGGRSGEFAGYITSGGTESNLFSAWVGRNYLTSLRESKTSRLCLIKTSLTHYSVTKNSDILNLKEYIAPLDESALNMDSLGLKALVKKLARQGYRNFLICLTLGYTLTGTSDNLEEIVKTVQSLKKLDSSLKFFIWIDAALNGFITPFLKPDFAPLGMSHVDAFVVDLHKFGMVSYPAGVVLYRQRLRKSIERTIDYLPEKDTTISGSRTGIPSIAIWAMINHFGFSGYQKKAVEQMLNKRIFCDEFMKLFPDAEIFTDAYGLSCGFQLRKNSVQKLPTYIENKYGLRQSATRLICTTGIKQKYLYKIYFLPHMRRRIVEELLHDLRVFSKK